MKESRKEENRQQRGRERGKTECKEGSHAYKEPGTLNTCPFPSSGERRQVIKEAKKPQKKSGEKDSLRRESREWKLPGIQ